MDQNKKKALIEWMDALSESKVKSFEDLRDGSIITSMLVLLGDSCLQSDQGLDTQQGRFLAIKKYVNAFYHQSVDERQIFNIDTLLNSHASGELYDMEMGKLLLALLGCVVQDKCREKFIQPAFKMGESSQVELKEMIEAVLFNTDMETQITADFHDVLKRKMDSSTQQDAAFFFKLVAGSAASPRVAHLGTPTSNQQHPSRAETPVFAMYTNSPQHGNTSVTNIREISSPLRIMSLSSPQTPLSALMHSPQLAQKIMSRETEKRRESEAMLRQKIQEFKRLEVALQCEQHLRSELELDLRERSAMIEERDAKLRDLEKQLGEVRWMRDQLDELELLRTEKEKLGQENSRLQTRLTKYEALKDHSAVLESENKEIQAEVQKAREEMKLLETVKKSCEDYRVRCHKKQLEMSEKEATLQKRLTDIEQLTISVEETRNMYEVAQSQCNVLRKEKEELEEMMGSAHGEMGVGLEGAMYAGEPMSIVTDKKLSELQIEYDHMKENWVEPGRYQTTLKDLEMEKEARVMYEQHYIEMKQKIMCSDDEIQMLKNKIGQQEAKIAELESSLSSSHGAESDLRMQVSNLESNCDLLKKSETDLLGQTEQLEEKIKGLEKEILGLQTELDLNRKEIEVQQQASETRRLTILQLDNEKNVKHQSEQRLSSELQSWKTKVEELKQQLLTMKEDSQKSEGDYKDRLEKQQGDLESVQTELKTEKYERELMEKTLTEKVSSLQESNKEITDTLNQEKIQLNKQVTDMENQVSLEREAKEEQIQALKLLTNEYEAYQSSVKEKEEDLSAGLKTSHKDKQELELQVHRLNCEIKSLSESNEEKIEKLESKHTLNEEALKSDLADLTSKHNESLKLQATLKEELSESKLQVQKLKLDIKKLNETIQEFQQDNLQLGNSIEKSKMNLIGYEYELKACKQKMANELEQFNRIKQEKDDMITGLHFQHQTTVEQFKKEKSALLEQISELENTLENEKRTFNELQASQKKSFSETESKLESQVKLLMHEKNELASSHESYVKDLKSSSDDVNKTLIEKLNALQKKFEGVESERFELECGKKELSVRIQTMSEQLHEYEKNQNTLVDNMNKACSSVQELNSEKETLTTDLEKQKKEFENNLQCLQLAMKTMEEDSTKTKEDLSLAKNDLENKLQLTVAETEKLIEQVKELESESKTAKDTLTSEIDMWKSKLEKNKEKHSKLKKHVGDLEHKLKHLSQSRADLECQYTESSKESEKLQSDLEEKLKSLKAEKFLTDELFVEYKTQKEAELEEARNKHTETESYWQSQCEQLAEEYSRGVEEQKEVMRIKLEEVESNHESELQNLRDEKDMHLASEVQAFKDIVTELEKSVSECKAELVNVSSCKESQAADYERRLSDLSALVVKYEDDCASITGESEVLKAKCENLEKQVEEKVKNIEMLIGEYETQISENKSSHEDTFCTMSEEHASRVNKLESDMDEQRVNYQKMISEMEEKLGGETFDLRARFSQMKCQYETLIESKEKDTKEKLGELESKVKSLTSDNTSLEELVKTARADSTRKQSDISELLAKNTELKELLEKSKQEHEDIENQLAMSVDSVTRLENDLKSVQEELTMTGEDMLKEKGERQETERQLEYTRDRNDTLTAELSSQQQQLAAVEEEKRMLEEASTKNKQLLEQLQQQAEKDLRFREIEKHELERQLQSSQTCYEAMQKAQSELESQIERMGQDRLQLEERNRELEARIYNYLEREKKMVEDNQRQINMASDLNNTLRKQLDEKTTEIRAVNEKFNKEMEMTQTQFTQMKSVFEKDLRTLTEEKTVLEIEAATLLTTQKQLAETEAERKKLQDVNEKYNIHYNKKKEVIAQLTEELKAKNQELENVKVTEEKMVKEVTPLREKLQAEMMKTKSLAAQVQSLEAQVDLADRKIRELKQIGEKDSAHFFGDSSDFYKMIRNRENSEDASFMENHPGTIPMTMDYDDLGLTVNSTSNNTLTPGRESRTRKRLSKSCSSTLVNKENHNDLNADTVSIGSASSLAYRLRSRESAVSLNRSISSFDSYKSNASVPRGTGRVFHCEDEPLQLEWGRLGELQRRNTLCPAHLKTSYPVETQTYKPNKFQDAALRESTMGNSTILQADTGSGRKRKKNVDTDSSEGDSADSKSKLAKTGPAYHKPGPPTPANSRRSSKGSRSPGGRLSSGRTSRSPKTPVQVRGKRTPRRTPKRTAMEVDGNGSAKKLGKRESVSFSVGFSPVSNIKSSSRLTRQHAFIQKQPQSSGQMLPPKRKPLGIRNFLQTGL